MNRVIENMTDIRTMAGRCLLLSRRNPDTFLTSTILPILLMFLFTFVLGGAINVGNLPYVNFIVPGILLQCIAQCASSTAISVSDDIKKGIIDRFCTMPIRKSSILTGHVLEAVIRSSIAAFLAVSAALAAGFRPGCGITGWLCAVCILLLYIITFSWISVYFGIIANGPEGAGAFSVIALVLPYLSSGFVPVETMPAVLRIFSKYQPMTPVIESIRALLLGQPLPVSTLLAAVLWCLALLILFYLLSVRAFRKKITL